MRVSECGRKIRNANRMPKSDDRGKMGGRQGGGEGGRWGEGRWGEGRGGVKE